MRVLVTRPANDAPAWVQALAAQGHEAQALPLIAITPLTDAAQRQALLAAWGRLDQYRALMFVSGNAAFHFFAAAAAAAPPALHAWATGPGTRSALLQAGVAAACIASPPDDSPQFDSEALWRLVGGTVNPGDRVLVVRGANARGESAGRDWFAQQLAAAGAQAEFLPVYERHLPVMDSAARARALAAATDGTVWLFSSSEAVANLGQLLPGQSWRAARCVVTHARIAQAARGAGFGVVCESRPDLADVVASIESIE